MGCDIHIAIERQDESGQWQEVGYTEQHFAARTAPEEWSQRAWARHDADVARGLESMPDSFTCRNYRLFATLADVRNYSRPTAEPLAAGRGLPQDATMDIERETDELTGKHWLGDHSHTWVSLSELQAHQWDEFTQSWPDEVIPKLEQIAAGRPLRLILGFDS